MSEQPRYDGELISMPLVGLTPSEQLALLNWHPLFTGRCPECERPILQRSPRYPTVWACEHCGWVSSAGSERDSEERGAVVAGIVLTALVRLAEAG